VRFELELTDEQLEAIAERVAGLVPAPTERWLSQRELAEHFGCSVRTILTYQKAGMPHLMIGSHPRFKASECEAWLDSRNGSVGRLSQPQDGAAPPVTARPRHQEGIAPDAERI
jgi:hypothetical protein